MTTTQISKGQEQKKTPKGKINPLTGIDMGYVDRKRLVAAMKKLKIEFDPELTDDQLVVHAQGQFEALTKKDELVKCPTCGGKSDVDFDECPFCGSEGAEEVAEDRPAGKVEASEVKEPKTKEAKMATATTETKGKAAKNGASTALAKSGPSMLSGANPSGAAAQLDAAVGRARKLLNEAGHSYWKLGREIAVIKEQGLWKQRMTEAGKQSYKSFEAFCNAELNITPVHALALVDTSSRFSEDQVSRFGVSKLALVFRAPTEDQERLLGEVEKGATKRALAEQVKKLKKEKGHRKAARDGRASTDAKTAKASEAREKKAKVAKTQITVASIVGRQKIKLYEKPTTKSYELKDLKRAKKIGQQPFGRLELTNGVVQEFYVQESASGEWELVINTRRDDE